MSKIYFYERIIICLYRGSLPDISDFIPNRETVDPNTHYNEQTVNKFLANVQDYYKIIQTWDEAKNC